MKFFIGLFSILVALTSFTFLKKELVSTLSYDPDLIHISKVDYKNEDYYVIYMKRDGDRVKAKYFAASDNNGKTVFERYKSWSAGKNMILVSSGTYMTKMSNGLYRPEGLTIDNGVQVNRSLSKKFDALVIVYNTGGIVVSNLKEGNLTLQGGGIPASKQFDLRNSSVDNQIFMNWAKATKATAFQTHLLVYKNKLTIFENAPKETYERRFLAVGKDDEGNVVHVIIHCPTHLSLYEGSRKVLNFLNEFKDMKVDFMINLDTGGQDVLQLYDEDGSLNNSIKGKKELIKAVNLLGYYFE